ncbi:MAG: nitrilase-related carbon-nitrogen hydrolase [bacterium JZ-2024 1]
MDTGWKEAVLTGFLLYLAHYPYHWWPLQWVSGVLYLTYLTQFLSISQAILFSGIVGGISHLPILRGRVLGPKWLIGSVFLFTFAVYALSGGLLWWLYGRISPASRIFLFPVFLVTVEFLLSHGPYGVWVSEGYLQSPFLPITGIVAYTGIYGISFLIALFSSLLVAFLFYSPELPLILPGLLLFFFLILLGIGTWKESQPERIVQAGIVVNSEASGIKETFPEPQAQRALNLYLEDLKEVADKGAHIAFLPEVALSVYSHSLQEFIEEFQKVARTKKIHLAVAYCEKVNEEKVYNKVLVISSTGEILGEYRKRYPLFGVAKRVQRGDTPPLICKLNGVRYGFIICHDDCFPRWVRYVGRKEADVLVVPSKDWLEIAQEHKDVSLFRGLENGCTQIRITLNGYSRVTNPWGRVLYSRNTFASPRICEVVRIPVHRRRTLYPMAGDLFAWMNVVVFLYFLSMALIK